MCATDHNDLGLTDASCSCDSHAPAAGPAASVTEGDLASQTYDVTGMTCGHCVNSVTEEVSRIAGVTSVDVQLVTDGASRVTVTSSETLDRAAIAAAIDEAGYQLVDASR